MMSVPRPAMLVAMVTAGAAGLGHDLRFPLHVLRLGVEQVVGISCSASRELNSSLFSTEVVPTSTGRPFL